MIVHVFTAKRYHLVPNIAKGFATTYSNDAEHRFILNGDSTLDVNKYKQLFSEIGFANYFIVQSKIKLAYTLWKNQNSQILFHAGNISDFIISFLVRCKHVDWVCWGGDASIHKSFKSLITYPLNKYLYNHFDNIITLMSQDRDSLIRDFKIASQKIFTISYASFGVNTKYDSFYDSMLQKPYSPKEKKVVLLGNSPHNIDDYIEMLPLLKPYVGKIKVQCMNHYSLIKNEKYNQLIDIGTRLFGDDFRSNEEFYSYEDYLHYMNKCDIYICSHNSQTGLGAIGVCLQLGKKIYIHGKNYEWISTAYEAIVFDTDLIRKGLSWDLFSKELSVQEITHNLQSFRKHRMEAYESWKKYLSQKNSL